MTETDGQTSLRNTGERVIPEAIDSDDLMATVLLTQHLRRYELAAKHAPGLRVLDAGCGAGYGSAMLAEAGAEVVGIDVAADAVAHAKQRYGSTPGLTFRTGDLTTVGDLGSFDMATCFEVLEHVSDPDAALAVLHGALRPRGRLLISGVTYPTMDLYRYHLRDYTEATFQAAVERAGFAVEDVFRQVESIPARDVRRVMMRHRASFPTDRLARHPVRVLRSVWRSHVSEGLTHSDVMLDCVRLGD